MNEKTAAASPSQDISPLTDTPVLSKLSTLQSDIGSQQFKSPRLQQLLGNRTAAAAGSVSSNADVKPGDSVIVPADSDDGDALKVDHVGKLDITNETLDVADV